METIDATHFHLDKSVFPLWTKYVVIPHDSGGYCAPCSSVEGALECILRDGLELNCHVVRFEDELIVWPLMGRVGNA